MKRSKSKNRTNKRFGQQLSKQELHKSPFVIGDLYLFHPTKKYCPAKSSLWGIYDKREDGIIYLESSTLDLIHFKLWHRLPKEYRYARRATRRELRDYMYNIGYRDSQMRYLNTSHQLSEISLKSIFVRPRARYSFPRDMVMELNGNA